MPTFDFLNILRGVIQVSLRFVSNPFVIFTTLATGVGALVATGTTFVLSEFISPVTVLNIYYEGVNSELMDIFLYTFNFDLLVALLDGFIKLVPALIAFVLTFLTTLYVLCMAYRGAHALRQNYKDLKG